MNYILLDAAKMGAQIYTEFELNARHDSLYIGEIANNR